MVKKKASKKALPSGRKRHRRSDEELISDLKDKIKELKERQEARKLKQSPAIKATVSAVRSLDKALDHAAHENNSVLRHALADARKPLASYLGDQGLKLPRARLPRGRRPRSS